MQHGNAYSLVSVPALRPFLLKSFHIQSLSNLIMTTHVEGREYDVIFAG
jgi:hypothetical protein